MASRSVNKVILLGNLGKDAETRFTTGGAARTTFSVATSRTMERPSDWRVERRDRLAPHRPLAPGERGHLPDERASRSTSKAAFRRTATTTRTARRFTGPRLSPMSFILLGGRGEGAGSEDSQSQVVSRPRRADRSGRSSSRRTAGGIRRNRRRRAVLTASRADLQSSWGLVCPPTVPDSPAGDGVDSAPLTAARDSLALSLAKTHEVASTALAPVGVRAEEEQQAPPEAHVVVTGGPGGKLGSHAGGTSRLRQIREIPGPVHETPPAVPATQRPDAGEPRDLLRRAAQVSVTQIPAATAWTLWNHSILSIADTLVRGHVQLGCDAPAAPYSPRRSSAHTPRRPPRRAAAHPLSAAPGCPRSPAPAIGSASWM